MSVHVGVCLGRRVNPWQQVEATAGVKPQRSCLMIQQRLPPPYPSPLARSLVPLSPSYSCQRLHGMLKHQTHIVVQMLVCYLQQLSFFVRGPRSIVCRRGAVVVPMDAVGCARSAIDGTDPVLPKLIAPVLDCLIDTYTAEPVHSACYVMPSHCQIAKLQRKMLPAEKDYCAVVIIGISRRGTSKQPSMCQSPVCFMLCYASKLLHKACWL